ncbi:putative membrane protein [Paenibacillus turicensis]|uniref:Membrane protein n=1 Tax=Paenibacillus turicensis TaxID=160487 RepID=A0ABS4FWR0_9BACL|nr:hypothetical protein [Paenibacillus turicensis]MBP1906899.1 putative membrane protein [Paenibacillus turicensis]
MNGWKQGWFIFKRDVITDRLYLIWSLVFMIYTGVMVGIMLDGQTKAFEILSPFSDFMLMVLIPMSGFYFSRRSFHYIRDDSYTKMLWYYRTLPIPIDTIMKSRLIQLVSSLVGNGLILYTTLYISSSYLHTELNIGQMFLFILTWSGFALFINGFYIYFELLFSGRKYLWLTFLILLFTTALVVTFNLLDFHLTTAVIQSVKTQGAGSTYMWSMIVVGVIFLSIMLRIVRNKLQIRDLRQ